jgi:hypothetical protein
MPPAWVFWTERARNTRETVAVRHQPEPDRIRLPRELEWSQAVEDSRTIEYDGVYLGGVIAVQ